MIFVIYIAHLISYYMFFVNYIPYIENQYIYYGIAFLLAIGCIALNKVNILGYLSKLFGSILIMNKLVMPMFIYVTAGLITFEMKISYIIPITGVGAFLIFIASIHFAEYTILETPNLKIPDFMYYFKLVLEKLHLEKVLKEKESIQDSYENICRKYNVIMEENKRLQREIDRLKGVSQSKTSKTDLGFFVNCKTNDAVKKRYHMLSKIYHPDNENGDDVVFSNITREYQNLYREYISART